MIPKTQNLKTFINCILIVRLNGGTFFSVHRKIMFFFHGVDRKENEVLFPVRYKINWCPQYKKFNTKYLLFFVNIGTLLLILQIFSAQPI